MKNSITDITKHDEFSHGSRLLSYISERGVTHACVKENGNILRRDLNA